MQIKFYENNREFFKKIGTVNFSLLLLFWKMNRRLNKHTLDLSVRGFLEMVDRKRTMDYKYALNVWILWNKNRERRNQLACWTIIFFELVCLLFLSLPVEVDIWIFLLNSSYLNSHLWLTEWNLGNRDHAGTASLLEYQTTDNIIDSMSLILCHMCYFLGTLECFKWNNVFFYQMQCLFIIKIIILKILQHRISYILTDA